MRDNGQETTLLNPCYDDEQANKEENGIPFNFMERLMDTFVNIIFFHTYSIKQH